MIYLNLYKLQLKSFNIIESRFFKEKLTVLNYIIFFFNTKYLLNLYKQYKVLKSLFYYFNKIIKQYNFILNPNSIFNIFSISNLNLSKLCHILNKITIKLHLIKILLKVKEYQFNFYLKLLINYSSLSITKLPVKLKKFTVLKSPHIFKKHWDQYQINYYKYFINFIIFNSNYQIFNIFNNLRFQSSIESTLHITTFIKND